MENIEQRTEAWFKAREGKLTASSFAAAAGLGPGSRQQVWRRHMGLEEFYQNEAMNWGTENEPHALAAYSTHFLVEGEATSLVGFVQHKDLAWLGCSPDVLVGSKGLGEIKCPASKVIYPDVPIYYMAQMQGQMEVTDREWCDFIVWTPDALSVRRVQRCPEYWQWLYEKLADFWMYVEAQIEPPRAKREKPPETAHLVGKETLIQLNVI
jgi:putative phage-type endonuclease